MPFPIHINILDFIVKGILIGIIVSAPMGPVGVLCVQRTLNKGRWYGFVTGVGATASDIIYAGMSGFGMSWVMDFVNNQQNKFYLQIIGSMLPVNMFSTLMICKNLKILLLLIHSGNLNFLNVFSMKNKSKNRHRRGNRI